MAQAPPLVIRRGPTPRRPSSVAQAPPLAIRREHSHAAGSPGLGYTPSTVHFRKASADGDDLVGSCAVRDCWRVRLTTEDTQHTEHQAAAWRCTPLRPGPSLSGANLRKRIPSGVGERPGMGVWCGRPIRCRGAHCRAHIQGGRSALGALPRLRRGCRHRRRRAAALRARPARRRALSEAECQLERPAGLCPAQRRTERPVRRGAALLRDRPAHRRALSEAECQCRGATDAREKGRIGILGSALAYAGSSPRITSEKIGRDVNPLGRGSGMALVGGQLNLGRIAPRLPQGKAVGGSGSSVNNSCGIGGGCGGIVPPGGGESGEPREGGNPPTGGSKQGFPDNLWNDCLAAWLQRIREYCNARGIRISELHCKQKRWLNCSCVIRGREIPPDDYQPEAIDWFVRGESPYMLYVLCRCWEQCGFGDPGNFFYTDRSGWAPEEIDTGIPCLPIHCCWWWSGNAGEGSDEEEEEDGGDGEGGDDLCAQIAQQYREALMDCRAVVKDLDTNPLEKVGSGLAFMCEKHDKDRQWFDDIEEQCMGRCFTGFGVDDPLYGPCITCCHTLLAGGFYNYLAAGCCERTM